MTIFPAKKKVIGISIFAIFVLGIGIIIYKPQILTRLKLEVKRIITNSKKINTIDNNIFKTDTSIYGIDISHHQGKINWSKVKTWKNHKISFVYIKATEGATHVDPDYTTSFKGAKKNNFLVGSYHYFRTSSPVKSQLNHFISHVDKDSQDLIPLVDVEEMRHWDSKTFHKNFKLFLELIEEHFGEKPMIYTVNSFYNKHLSDKYREYHFLIGRYGPNAPNMRDRSNWTIWQFSESGKVNGISKNVDIDVLNPKFELSDLLL